MSLLNLLERNNLDTFLKILRNNPNVSIIGQDNNLNTILHIASKKKLNLIISLILNHKDIDLIINKKNIYGDTPINTYIKNINRYKNDGEIMLLFLEKLNRNTNDCEIMLLFLEKLNIDLNEPDEEGFTPFINLCIQNNKLMIKLFLNKINKFNINKTNNNIYPLYYVCYFLSFETLKLIINKISNKHINQLYYYSGSTNDVYQTFTIFSSELFKSNRLNRNNRLFLTHRLVNFNKSNNFVKIRNNNLIVMREYITDLLKYNYLLMPMLKSIDYQDNLLIDEYK